MLFILPGVYGLPPQLHNKVLKVSSMKHSCGEGIKELFSGIFHTEDITDMLSSNHNLSLYTKLMTVLNNDYWQSMK